MYSQYIEKFCYISASIVDITAMNLIHGLHIVDNAHWNQNVPGSLSSLTAEKNRNLLATTVTLLVRVVWKISILCSESY